MTERPKQIPNGSITDKERAGFLMDHYKDTFSILQGHWKARNRMFMYALILIALIAIDHFSGCSLADSVNDYLKNKFAPSSERWQDLDFAVIDFMARFVLLCVVIQYYQRSIHVDRSYRYVQYIEEQICKRIGRNLIAREGKAYYSLSGRPTDKKKRPLFLLAVGPLYTYVFPVALSLLMLWGFLLSFPKILYGFTDFLSVVLKLVGGAIFGGSRAHQSAEFDQMSFGIIIELLSAMCSVAIIGYSIMYMVWVRRKKDSQAVRKN